MCFVWKQRYILIATFKAPPLRVDANTAGDFTAYAVPPLPKGEAYPVMRLRLARKQRYFQMPFILPRLKPAPAARLAAGRNQKPRVRHAE